MDGTITSAVVDSSVISNVGQCGNGLELTGRHFAEVFKVATGQEAKATEIVTMEHNLHEPAQTFNVMPGVTLDLLVSTIKFSNAGYFTILDKEEVNVYDAQTMKAVASKPPFEDGRLGSDNLCQPCVVDVHLLFVEDGEVPGVAELARARERVESDVGHHVEHSHGIAEVVLHGCGLGGLRLLSRVHLEHLGGRAAGHLEAVAVSSDIRC